MSNCTECRVDYLTDKLSLLERCYRRDINVRPMSPMSSDVTDTISRNIEDFAAFAAKWKKGRGCTHAARTAGVLSTTREEKTENEIFVPEEPSEPSIDLVEPGRNVGISALTTNPIGSSHHRGPGRPTGSKNKSSSASATAAATGGGRGASRSSRR